MTSGYGIVREPGAPFRQRGFFFRQTSGIAFLVATQDHQIPYHFRLVPLDFGVTGLDDIYILTAQAGASTGYLYLQIIVTTVEVPEPSGFFRPSEDQTQDGQKKKLSFQTVCVGR